MQINKKVLLDYLSKSLDCVTLNPVNTNSNKMKKLYGIILIFIGAILVIISIMVLVKAFDIFNTIGPGFENFGYVMGSILFPLLLTVFGRWVFRKGTAILRAKKL